jgi:2-keto-3-deoxy-L-rhamnonate aldolase RhmA
LINTAVKRCLSLYKNQDPTHKLADITIGALDAGAHGIVVPLIYSVDDAKRLVASAKFPPEGNRGFGSPFSPHAFNGETLTDYLQNANSSIQTIVQIETKCCDPWR